MLAHHPTEDGHQLHCRQQEFPPAVPRLGSIRRDGAAITIPETSGFGVLLCLPKLYMLFLLLAEDHGGAGHLQGRLRLVISE